MDAVLQTIWFYARVGLLVLAVIAAGALISLAVCCASTVLDMLLPGQRSRAPH